MIPATILPRSFQLLPRQSSKPATNVCLSSAISLNSFLPSPLQFKTNAHLSPHSPGFQHSLLFAPTSFRNPPLSAYYHPSKTMIQNHRTLLLGSCGPRRSFSAGYTVPVDNAKDKNYPGTQSMLSSLPFGSLSLEIEKDEEL